MIDRLLFGGDKNISKRIYFWNLCSSMIYSVQSAILLLVVTRVGGLVEGGIFSIIYTVTQMFASLGSYSMRNFQVSDVRNEYSFKEYYSSRVLTCTIMVIICLGYGILRGNGFEYIFVVLMFSLYRAVDGMEDVYHGAVQKDGRLDAVSVAQAIRITISVAAFSIIYIITHNLVAASIGLFGSSVVLLLFFNHKILDRFVNIRRGVSLGRVPKLLTVCFPIFLGAILYNYLVNVPKYAIDRNLGEEYQTLFNILFMPVFVINILSIFIFKPMVNKMGQWWNDGKRKEFVTSMLRQAAIIILLTVAASGVGYIAGCPVLSLIYGVNLSDYPPFFAMLLLFGGIAALSTFLSVVLTIMRKQYFIIFAYSFAWLISVFMTDKMVIRYGINGAGYAYGIIMGSVLLFFVLSIMVILLLGKKSRKNDSV